MFITRSYKPLCFHRSVAAGEERDDDTAEIATNKTWRGIMVRARKDHKLTQTELGAKVGLSQVMISKIESGQSGGSSEILAICGILKIQPPQHFADEWQKKWAELGQVLRHKSPDHAEAAMRLVEAMSKPASASPETDPEKSERLDRRK